MPTTLLTPGLLRRWTPARAVLFVLPCALLILALAGCDTVRPDRFDDHPLLYVCNQNSATISLIDMDTNELVETVDLQDYGFSATAKPHHVDVESDGSHWYVSLIGENTIAKFSRENELVGTVDFESPGMVDIGPDDEILYASHTMSIVNVPSTVAAIATDEMTLVDEVDVFLQRPHGMIVHPDGEYAYTASLSSNQYAVIDTETQEAEIVDQGGEPVRFVHFAPSPNGQQMYVTGQTAGIVQLLDISDPADPVRVTDISVEGEPWHPVYTPGGRRVYFGNKAANRVTVIDADAREIETVIEDASFNRPHGSATSADGRFVYISNNGDEQTPSTVTVIRTATNEVAAVIEVGVYPTGIGNAF